MSVSNDIYEEFAEYFYRIVQQHSKNALVLAHNCLYIEKGLLKSPVEIRNGVIDDICATSYESMVEVFQLKRLPSLQHKKLIRIINAIRNKNVD